MTFVDEHKTTLLLAAASALMATVVALQLAFPVSAPAADDAGSSAAEVPDLADPPAWVPTEFGSYTSILERPLLYVDRRLPAPPEEEVEPQAPLEPLRLKLEGVALAGGSRVALLRGTVSNELINMAEGMTHNGWTLESVQPDRAVFRRDNDVSELPLEVQPGRGRRR